MVALTRNYFFEIPKWYITAHFAHSSNKLTFIGANSTSLDRHGYKWCIIEQLHPRRRCVEHIKFYCWLVEHAISHQQLIALYLAVTDRYLAAVTLTRRCCPSDCCARHEWDHGPDYQTVSGAPQGLSYPRTPGLTEDSQGRCRQVVGATRSYLTLPYLCIVVSRWRVQSSNCILKLVLLRVSLTKTSVSPEENGTYFLPCIWWH